VAQDELFACCVFSHRTVLLFARTLAVSSKIRFVILFQIPPFPAGFFFYCSSAAPQRHGNTSPLTSSKEGSCKLCEVKKKVVQWSQKDDFVEARRTHLRRPCSYSAHLMLHYPANGLPRVNPYAVGKSQMRNCTSTNSSINRLIALPGHRGKLTNGEERGASHQPLHDTERLCRGRPRRLRLEGFHLRHSRLFPPLILRFWSHNGDRRYSFGEHLSRLNY
jgi:hypothetical protein